MPTNKNFLLWSKRNSDIFLFLVIYPDFYHFYFIFTTHLKSYDNLFLVIYLNFLFKKIFWMPSIAWMPIVITCFYLIFLHFKHLTTLLLKKTGSLDAPQAGCPGRSHPLHTPSARHCPIIICFYTDVDCFSCDQVRVCRTLNAFQTRAFSIFTVIALEFFHLSKF